MQIAPRHPVADTARIARFAAERTGVKERLSSCGEFGARVVELMPLNSGSGGAEETVRRGDGFAVAEGGEAVVHLRFAGEQAEQRMAGAVQSS